MMIKFLKPKIDCLNKEVRSWNIIDIAATLTLILLILYSGGKWYLRVPIKILCISAFLYKPLRINFYFWFMMTAFIFASHFHNWYLIDNHKYLMFYWCLAICLSTLSFRKEKNLKFNARILIGLCFLFATFWKVTTQDFMNSTFFQYALLLDGRFKDIANILGGLSTEAFLLNRDAIIELTKYNSGIQNAELVSTKGVQSLSKFLTWWTIGIESSIALAFLWPKDKFISKIRDFLLLIFIITTYSVASVIGFAWLLIIMGITQSASFKYVRESYLAAFLLLVFFSAPWESIVKYFLQ